MIPFYYFILIHTILQISYIPSIFLLLLHIKCIKIKHVSLFPLVHIHTNNHYTSMPSFRSLSRKNILPLPSVLLLHQQFHTKKPFLDILSHSFSPFCVIETILPCSSITLLYYLTYILLPSFLININSFTTLLGEGGYTHLKQIF